MIYTKEETFKAKALAVLLLIFHHMYYLKDDMSVFLNLTINQQEMLQKCAVAMRCCVWIFVFLSGYGLSYVWKNKYNENVVTFELCSWLNIYSLFLPIIGLYYISAILTGDIGDVFNRPIYVMTNLIGLSDIFGAPHFIAGFWYIGFSLMIILFFPVFFSLCEKMNIFTLPMLMVITRYLSVGINSGSGGRYTDYLYALVLGVLFFQNRFFEKICFSKKVVRYVLYLGILILASGLAYFAANIFTSDFWDIRFVIISISATMLCLFSTIFAGDNFISKGMIKLGEYSGIIYLMHPLVIKHMKTIIYLSKNWFVAYVCCVIISVIFSVLWKWFLTKTKYYDLLDNIRVKIREKMSI